MKPGQLGPGEAADGEQRFRTALEASPNAIVAVDHRGRVIYANPQVETTFGYARTELIGEPVELLIPDRVSERLASVPGPGRSCSSRTRTRFAR